MDPDERNCRLEKWNRVSLAADKSIQVIVVALDTPVSLEYNAGRVLACWNLHDEFWDGDLIHVQSLPSTMFGAHTCSGHRALIHLVLFRYAVSLGGDTRMGQEVIDYSESYVRPKLGSSPFRRETEARPVVVADGTKSKQGICYGVPSTTPFVRISTYRASFDAKEHGVDMDPLTGHLCRDGDRETLKQPQGKDVHMLAGFVGGGKSGSSSSPGRIEDVDRDPRCAAVMSTAQSCVEWELLFHDPLPAWLSEAGQCTPQAIEDGVTLAATLSPAGKDGVPLAARAWEVIRYDRERKTQLMGESTRDKWHSVKVGDREAELDLPKPEWLLAFAAEAHAYSVLELEGSSGGVHSAIERR
ncbi:hypothetical protein BU15DRAFT_86123 [Melanogaster broomeanus]|nr:hypothetical protein BU15DRAFT_86123 [Melanogaster broomeanus]